MEHFDDEAIYATGDFLTAAFLLAKGVTLFGKRTTGRRVHFLFHDDGERRCGHLSQRLLNGDDNVSATQLHVAMKRLKRVIYDE